jgi:class 3 adenylate cyclase/tetratricopeptide (TPR) repeat protein
MNCPHCQTANPDSAKFCMNCGNALVLKCTNCGTELPPAAKFCMNCGQAIAQAQPAPVTAPTPSTDVSRDTQLQRYMPSELLSKINDVRENHRMEGERRIVTMLFCDVKGSTAMAETLDPEEWTSIMNKVFEYMIAAVYKYEGTVARLMGDAILAFFGAPIAHEDDAQRAALAGLAIVNSIRSYRDKLKQERGLEFDVRVGINTGLVVVGSVGSDLRVEYTAMGDAVNLAARMEQTAKPGTVQISNNTYKLIAPLFETESLGSIEVKGKREPIPTYLVIAPKAQPGSLRGITGLHSPMVGRDAELNQLQQALAGVRSGKGRIASVVGEAGLGKSRLIAELKQSAAPDLDMDDYITEAEADQVKPLRWYEGRCLSYQTAAPYTPFIHMFNAMFNLLDLPKSQSDGEQYRSLKAKLVELVGETGGDIAPFMASLLGYTPDGDDLDRIRFLEPPILRGRVFQSVITLIEKMATERLLVLVFEDLHWSDATSLDLLEQLMPVTDKTMLMLVLLFRPQRQDPTWRLHETANRDFAHRYTPIHLDLLPENESRTLVANLLQIEDLPEKVRLLILQRSEGNPFFVEEVIRSLLDAGLVVQQDGHWRATREIENIALPDTLAGVISARLDRLEPETRRVLQTASVIGREFQVKPLEMVYAESGVEGALLTLQQRELIREKSRYPQLSYFFKHVLTQEASYQSLLLSRRRELHLRTAESLEKLNWEHPSEIGWHFAQAQALDRALPYIVDAADSAAKNYAVAEANILYKQALDILKQVDNLALARRTYEGLARILTLSNDIQGAVSTYKEMLALAETHNDVPMRVSALNKLSIVLVWLGQFQQINEHLTVSEDLARKVNDLAGLAEMYVARCSACLSAADFEAAIRYLQESVQIGRSLTLTELRIFGLGHLANTFTMMTQFDEAWSAAQECRTLAAEVGDKLHVAEVLAFPIPFHYLLQGDLDTANQHIEEGRQIGSQIGDVLAEAWAGWLGGMIAQMRGEYQRALEINLDFLRAARGVGFPIFEAMALGTLGSAYLNISNTFADEITEVHMKALQMLEHPAALGAGAVTWAELGFCVLKLHDLTHAAEMFEKGLTIPTMPMMVLKPRLLVGKGLVALEKGDSAEALNLITEARQFAEERGMKFYDPFIAIAMGFVYTAMEQWDRALDSFDTVERIGSAMKMRPIVMQAREQTARILAHSGKTDAAETKHQAAREMQDEIVSLFTDDKLRTLYLANIAAQTEDA